MEKILICLLSIIFILLSAENLNSQDIQKTRKEKNIPASLMAVWGLEKDSNYYKRIFAIHKLGASLSQTEVESLVKFLHCRLEEEPGLANLELNALKNEIVIALMKQNTPMYPELARQLREMYSDSSYDEVWRNYCIQFLGQIYTKLDDDEKRTVRSILFDAAKERKNSIGGTALIAVAWLNAEPGFDRDEISKMAYSYVQGPETVVINKITALQICAQLKYMPALDEARKIAYAAKGDVPLKMSAIAAVGLLGDSRDLAMLNNLSRSSDVRLQRAASKAVTNIKKSKE